MKIDKTIKGERFRFYVDLVPNTMKAKVRRGVSSESVEGVIAEDFQRILLPSHYDVNTFKGNAVVGFLKLSKAQRHEAMGYNGVTPELTEQSKNKFEQGERIQIGADMVEFNVGGNTIWVQSKKGTVMRIKCTGTIKVDACTTNQSLHSDVILNGDINFCISNDLKK